MFKLEFMTRSGEPPATEVAAVLRDVTQTIESVLDIFYERRVKAGDALGLGGPMRDKEDNIIGTWEYEG